MKKIIIAIGVLLIIGIIVLFNYTPPLSDQDGQLDITLYSGDSLNQPLVVAFGGGGGGNDWSRSYMKDKREALISRGYAVLAIGYFNSGKGTPKYLDRISLSAIADTVLQIARSNEKIDENKIALIGGSKGGELVLNLASRYKQFNSVIAMSTSHVSFPALTPYANTSSWTYDNKEVIYVPAPLKTIIPAIKGDLFEAFKIMLEDEQAVKNAEIEVENIKGSILILSASEDEQWPATRMSNRLMKRLEENDFKYPYEHIVFKGSHIEPLNHFDKVITFLDSTYKK